MDHEDVLPLSPREPSATLLGHEAETVSSDASAFYRFETQIIDLDRELRQLSNAARQLGSSVAILSASFRLCERLSRVLFLFRENAVALFPHRVHTKRRELQVDRYWNFKRQRSNKRRNRLLRIVARISTSHDQPSPHDLPNELHALAKDITTIFDCFSQYPEFVDEVPEQDLENELKGWADYLASFSDDIETPAVRKYVHDLSIRIGDKLQTITKFIPSFIRVGIPTIRGAQKGSAGNLVNLSTVATLFSGVTATMIQFSYQNNVNSLGDAVNGFWFTSLVFSISAAVNSLLGLTWMQAVFRSPDHRVPWWVLIWIKRSPLAFLVLSVACFFIGLVLFAYSSQQNRVTAVLTAVLSAMCCFGLAALSIWFACERWIFSWHKGNRLLSDVLADAGKDLLKIRIIAWSLDQYHRVRVLSDRLARRWAPVSRAGKKLVSRLFPTDGTTVDAASANGDADAATLSMDPLSPVDLEAQTVFGDDGAVGSTRPPKERFRRAVNKVIALQHATTGSMRNTETIAARTMPRRRNYRGMSDVSATMPSGVISTLVPKLKHLEVAQQMDVHHGLVMDVQFSPDGSLLATTSEDKQTKVLAFDDELVIRHNLTHSGLVGQLEWSPSGKMLLTKASHVIRLWIWTETGIEKKVFIRKLPIESIQWLPNSDAFLSLENEHAVKMDLSGAVVIRYTIPNMALSDATVTQTGHWMICVGTYAANGKTSEEGNGMNQIILYCMRTCTVAQRAPLFHDATDVSLASDDQSLLLSFGAKAPPQLWKLQFEDGSVSLTLRHSFTSTPRGEFGALASIFGGDNDSLVLRAETAGDIHIWDRDSATLLHHIRPPTGLAPVTSLAWNAAARALAFATGGLDGAVRVWGVAPPEHAVASSSGHPSPTPEHASAPATFRRHGSSFGLGYRSESPAGQFVEDEDDDARDVFDSPVAQAPRRVRRRATTGS